MGLRKAETPMSGVVQLVNRITKAYGKQPGRRFGPATRGTPAVQSPGMGTDRREDNYRRQTGRIRRPMRRQEDVSGAPEAYARLMGLTPRQRRRSWHKELSAARIIGEQELARRAEIALAEVPVQRERKEVTA